MSPVVESVCLSSRKGNSIFELDWFNYAKSRMTTTQTEKTKHSGFGGGKSVAQLIATYLGLAIVDSFAFFLIYAFARDGVWHLAITIGLITLMVNVINLRDDLYPLRWISPALALMGLMIVFPIVYTFYVSLTNYGDGNILTKQQAIARLAIETYLPEGAKVYKSHIYQNSAGDYALWLTDESDGDKYYFATLTTLEAVTSVDVGADLPVEYNGYRQLDRGEVFRSLSVVQDLSFGSSNEKVGITDTDEAEAFEQQYVYQPDQDAVLDKESGELYFANSETGQFENQDGDTLLTGFITIIGFDNYVNFLTSPAISGPLLRIFAWTIGFALISVVSTFAVGLLFALLLQNDKIPFKKVFRTLLIVPYAIPGLISVAIWRGMFNPNLGVITNMLSSLGIAPPPFFTDPGWAKFGILLINLWLGYPYFMLVCSGALAAIPSDMYEAAEVDGANWWDKFRSLTFPMLLVAVGPLLIASFTYNFNNFVIIETYDEGGPPIAGTPTPAGHTDILISYAFRLAFGGGRGADFGLASAITIIIFMMVAGITLLQFRFTKGWEETSENV